MNLPYTEGVRWQVMSEALTGGGENSREVQGLNGRGITALGNSPERLVNISTRFGYADAGDVCLLFVKDCQMIEETRRDLRLNQSS